MLRLFLIITVIATLSSCNKPTGIKELVSNADSVAINFYKGDGSMDTVVNVAILRNKEQVKQLAGYIESSSTKKANCGYDGSLHFFKNNTVISDIDFRMNDADCMHFVFSLDGKGYTTTLSGEAKRFLEAINKK